ncbi:MAG TPA: hypothetical protein DCL95_15925, partial [Rhodospirillaceae bacterium]|nr:hypothetical protein [Rhodospirillaceae bacterium]
MIILYLSIMTKARRNAMYLNTDRIQAAMLAAIAEEYATPEEKAARARTATRRAVMDRAWSIARMAARVFGGKAQSYIAGAMSQAWAEHRGECDGFSADATLLRIQARNTKAPTQRYAGYRGRA